MSVKMTTQHALFLRNLTIKLYEFDTQAEKKQKTQSWFMGLNFRRKPTFRALADLDAEREETCAERGAAIWQLVPDAGQSKEGNGMPEAQRSGVAICRLDLALAANALYRTVHSVRKIKSERAKSRLVRQLCKTRASSHARVCV